MTDNLAPGWTARDEGFTTYICGRGGNSFIQDRHGRRYELLDKEDSPVVGALIQEDQPKELGWMATRNRRGRIVKFESSTGDSMYIEQSSGVRRAAGRGSEAVEQAQEQDSHPGGGIAPLQEVDPNGDLQLQVNVQNAVLQCASCVRRCLVKLPLSLPLVSSNSLNASCGVIDTTSNEDDPAVDAVEHERAPPSGLRMSGCRESAACRGVERNNWPWKSSR